MNTYGYIRTCKAQEPGHTGSDPEAQRQQLLDSGVDPRHFFSDVGFSGAKGISTRNQWHALEQKLRQGHLLVEEGDYEANAKMRKASDHIGTLIETARKLTGGIGV